MSIRKGLIEKFETVLYMNLKPFVEIKISFIKFNFDKLYFIRW